MYKFIDRNKKKMIAVFGVMLMIVFVIPSTFMGNTGRDVVLGRMGDTKITGQEVQQAKEHLQTLKQYRFSPLVHMGEPNAMPWTPEGPIFRELEQHPEAWVLLQNEAKAAGAHVTDEQVQATAGGMMGDLLTMAPTAEVNDRIYPALKSYLLVRAGVDRAAGDVKVSQPRVRDAIARAIQETKLDVVEFSAEEFKGQVPAPTPEQVQAHYAKYADVYPDASGMTTTSPSQFGYKLPDRVRLQFVQLNEQQVLEQYLKTLAPEENWALGVAAKKYYNDPRNAAEFRAPPAPTSIPATGPATTQGSTLPATTQSATTQSATTQPAVAAPTTRPFAEIESGLRQRALRGELPTAGASVKAVQEKYAAHQNRLREALQQQFAGDYRAFASAGGPATAPASDPATTPTTGPAAPFPSVEYLQALADRFEKEHGVRPMVTSLSGDWKPTSDLEGIPGIGRAVAGGSPFTQLVLNATERSRTVNFGPQGPQLPPMAQPSTQATTQPATAPATSPSTRPADTQPATAPATAPAPATEAIDLVKLIEPSPVLTDAERNAYVFRVTAFEPMHVPPLAEVEAKVAEDLRLNAALLRAKEEAVKLLAAAKGEGAASLGSGQRARLRGVAEAAGRKVLTAGPVNRQSLSSGVIPGYSPEGMGRFQFLTEVFKLLQTVTAENSHPAVSFDLPGERKVLVIEVATFELPWPADEHARYMSTLAQEVRLSEEVRLAERWFNPDEITKRTGYTVGSGSGSSSPE